MMDFVIKLAEQPDEMKTEAQRRVDSALARGERIKSWGTVDGFCLCSDYCFNDNPFLSPSMFDEFVTPYLTELVAGYREMGFYVIKHTDGNIIPILDSLYAGYLAGRGELHKSSIECAHKTGTGDSQQLAPDRARGSARDGVTPLFPVLRITGGNRYHRGG